MFPSVINQNDFSVSVLEGGLALHLTVIWLDPLADMKLIHSKWLMRNGSENDDQFTKFGHVILALEDAFRQERDRASDNVISTAGIALPFAVQTLIKQKNNLSLRKLVPRSFTSS